MEMLQILFIKLPGTDCQHKHYGKLAAVGSYIMAYTKQAKCQGFSRLAAVNPWRFTMGYNGKTLEPKMNDFI